MVGQQRVTAKSNEIPALRTLLASYDLDAVVVTADALHTQTTTAAWLRERGAHYLLTVKKNQPTLYQQLQKLPWKNIPALAWSDHSHGRRVCRRVKTATAPAWISFPGASQVVQVHRTRFKRNTQGEKVRSSETVYLLCSLPSDQAQPHQIAA